MDGVNVSNLPAETFSIDPDNALTTFDYNGTFGRGDFLVFVNLLKDNNIKGTEMYAANATAEFEYIEITMQPKCVVTTHAGGSMFSPCGANPFVLY